MPPGRHLFGEGLRDQALAAQQGENVLPQPRLEHLARNGRRNGEAAVGAAQIPQAIDDIVRRALADIRLSGV